MLLHAMKPYGYAVGRRVTEDNIDLNRNFLQGYPEPSTELFPDDYGRFDGLLNPACAPRRSREGRQQLQDAIVTRQYAYPRGLFYGGCTQSQTVQVVSVVLLSTFAELATCCGVSRRAFV